MVYLRIFTEISELDSSEMPIFCAVVLLQIETNCQKVKKITSNWYRKLMQPPVSKKNLWKIPYFRDHSACRVQGRDRGGNWTRQWWRWRAGASQVELSVMSYRRPRHGPLLPCICRQSWWEARTADAAKLLFRWTFSKYRVQNKRR